MFKQNSVEELQEALKSAKNFLKYNSATTGETDWRPTETTPEDYYTF